MKIHHSIRRRSLARGLTLVEISLVIAMMLALASLATFSVGNMTEWKQAREAGESLRSVYMAQKAYLADHPSKDLTTLTEAELIPYLPNRLGAMPTVLAKDDSALQIKITVIPPVFEKGGATYDPSETGKDALWDVGAL